MKSFVFFATLLLLVNLSLQIPQLKNCPSDFVLTPSMANGCGVITCDGPNKASGVGCGTWDCMPGKHVGYIHADNSKPYPECCGGPICAD